MEDEALDNLKYRENSQGPFVRRPISAKPGVKFNPGFSLLCSVDLLYDLVPRWRRSFKVLNEDVRTLKDTLENLNSRKSTSRRIL